MAKKTYKRKTNAEMYELITEKLVSQIEKSGKLPWQKPWKTAKTTLRSGRVINPNEPINYVSKRNYNGINFWLLQCNEYDSNYWLTFKQMQGLKGKLKQIGTKENGKPDFEKATSVIYWDIRKGNKENKDGEIEEKTFYFLKYHNVWNFDQINFETQPKEIIVDVVENEEIQEIEPINAIETIIKNIPNCASISQNGMSRAFYRPSTDSIHIPKISSFIGIEEYYSTLIHEIAHSTGHAKRLNRDTLINNIGMGSDIYSKEELVAELSASFVLGITGVSTKETETNSAAYLQSWIKALKNDTKMIFWASKEATKATDYILNVKK